MARIRLILSIVFFALVALPLANAFAGEAGRVQFLRGAVRIVDATGNEHGTKKDEVLWEGDTVITGDDGELQAVMADNAFVAVRPNSRLKIEAYIANGTEEDRALYSLLVGTLRSITGWIGKYNRENYSVTTPTATIGVRGTDHSVTVVLEPQGGGSSPGQFEPGTYDVVKEGTTFIKTRFGLQDISAGGAGFAALRATAPPVLMDKIPQLTRALPNADRIKALKAKLGGQMDLNLRKKQQILQQLRSSEDAPQPLLKFLNSPTGQSDGSGASSDNPSRKAMSSRASKIKQKRRPRHRQR